MIAERIMWSRLRRKQFRGLKFRRQYCIGRYIVDFYCHEIGLVVEIDGDVHGYEERRKRDRIKDEFLKNRGFTVVRYTNRDVYDNLEGVMGDLYMRCEELCMGREK